MPARVRPVASRAEEETALITTARHGKSLDVRDRTRRYLWTMGARTLLFGAMFFVPGIWAKAACLVGAVVLPAAAVLLANDVDRRSHPESEHDHDGEAIPLTALTTGEVLRGEVVDEVPR